MVTSSSESPAAKGNFDGQIMVRLKKKQFIILDYSIEPTDLDLCRRQKSPHTFPFGGVAEARDQVHFT
jgi:hypothetical protein